MWPILFVPIIAGLLHNMPVPTKNYGVDIYYTERKATPKISAIDYGYCEDE